MGSFKAIMGISLVIMALKIRTVIYLEEQFVGMVMEWGRMAGGGRFMAFNRQGLRIAQWGAWIMRLWRGLKF